MELTKFYDTWFSSRLGAKPTISKRILFNEVMLRIREFIAASRQDYFNVLDVGCGAGHFAARLLQIDRLRVTGVDITEDTLAQCRKLYPQAEFRRIDFSKPQDLDASYDLVTAIEVIEHIPYDQKPIFVKNCSSALKSKGMFVLTTPNSARTKQIPSAYRNTQPVEDWLNINQLHALLETCFYDIRIGTCIWFFPNRYVDAIFKRLFYPFHVGLEQHLLRSTQRGCHMVASAIRRD